VLGLDGNLNIVSVIEIFYLMSCGQVGAR